VVFQASLLIRYAPPPVADAYCATRLAGEGGQTFGTLPSGLDLAPILERSTPKLG
jgi:putative acyl-CoA dehydrogenase